MAVAAPKSAKLTKLPRARWQVAVLPPTAATAATTALTMVLVATTAVVATQLGFEQAG